MSEIVTTGRLREAPWIGIGVSGHWTDYRDALQAAALDFKVYAERLHWSKPSVPIRDIPGYPGGFGTMMTTTPESVPALVTVRDRDNAQLGVVSERYGIVQNDVAFSLLKPFTDAGGVITNAGMTEQGLCFMVLRMKNQKFLGDDWDFDVMCCNSFNTRFPLSLMMVPMRIICQNMYRKLCSKNDMLLHVRHMSKADERIKSATRAVGMVGSYISAFEMSLNMANSHMLSAVDVDNLTALAFPYPKDEGIRYEASVAKVDAMRKEFIEDFYCASDNLKYRGTGLGFVNAYYDWLTHRDPGKCMPGRWCDRRLSGLVSGNDVKKKVIVEATGR